MLLPPPPLRVLCRSGNSGSKQLLQQSQLTLRPSQAVTAAMGKAFAATEAAAGPAAAGGGAWDGGGGGGEEDPPHLPTGPDSGPAAAAPAAVAA